MADALSRKLAAILHADVVGSTRLVQMDESLAHERIQDAFRRLSKTTSAYGGTAHEIRGDALVAEFARASDAVCAAIAFQAENAHHNAQLGGDICPELRVGISLGEVVVADSILTGAGVVLAQRLEQLAEPGRVVAQGSVAETVPTRLPFEFQSLGEQTLKGFDQPVRAFGVSLKAGEVVPEPEFISAESEVALALADHVIERPTVKLSDKPSIAVLPFTDLSGDTEQEYFADGIAEEVITALSRFHWFFVISRPSSFMYRGKSIDIKRVASELGVRYILSGSVRRSGNRVRITAQLLEGATGYQIWSDRYDREIDDVFAVQDELAQRIIAAVAPESLTAEIRRTRQKGEYGLDAWEMVMRAHWHLLRFTKRDSSRAKQLLLTVSRSEPNLSLAFSDLALIHVYEALFGWGESFEISVCQAEHAAQKAVELDERDAWAHIGLALVDHIRGRHEIALRRYHRAAVLNPNLAYAYGHAAMTLGFLRERKTAEQYVEMAIRLSPHDPAKVFWLNGNAMAAYLMEDYESAARWSEQMVEENPNYPGGLRILAANYGQLGRAEDARDVVKSLLEQSPSVTVTSTANQLPFRTDSDRVRYLEGLRKAGLPE